MYVGRLVQLGPLKREYLPQYLAWVNDPEVGRYLFPGQMRFLTSEDEEEWFDRVRKAQDQIVFAILTVEGGHLLGNCGLRNIDWKNRCASFGIFIGNKRFWGKGYGTEATRLLLRYAFEELNLHRVELEVYDFNTRAIRAYEKAGFRREGTRRQALYREGSWHDIHLMAILKEEWEANAMGQ
ncbi:MAG TPA: N-acetyltransferase [Chloroflexi bacterium]|nr:N-acetyltransferase [Chloroflexota bacterium]